MAAQNTNTIKIKIDVDNKPIKSLKTELRETIQQLQQTDLGTAKFEQLNARAAELKDKMAEVNEQVAVFATGSKYEQVSNSMGEITAGIASMDFDRVTQGAALFKKTAGSITFKDAIGSVKQLGGAIASIGKTILTNPLFLIAAVIAAIVVAVVMLMDKLGFLDKIMKALGAAVEFVIQKLKDLLDWMGLTSFAAEDSAQRQADAQAKVTAAHEKKRERVTKAYDQEIELANASGVNTTKIEKQKQYAIMNTTKEQIRSAELELEYLRQTGKLTADKEKEMRASIANMRTMISEASHAVKVIKAKEVQEDKKANETMASNATAAAEKRKAKAKEEAANRLAALRAIQDAELSIMAEGTEKELKANQLKYERLIADTNANEKLKEAEKKKLTDAFQIEQSQGEKAIKDKAKADSDAIIQEEQNAKLEAQNSLNQRLFELRAETSQKEIDALIIAQEEELVVLQEQLNKKLISEEQFQTAKKALAEKTSLEIDAINQAEADKEIQRKKLVASNSIDLATNVLNAISANAKQGSKAQKATAVGIATIDTFVGAQKAYTSQLIPGDVTSPIRGAIAAAAAIAVGVANVRKILAVSDNSTTTPSTSGGGGGGATPSLGSSAQPTPTMQLNQNTANQSAGGDGMRERVIVVDYNDIASKGNELQMMQEKVTLA